MLTSHLGDLRCKPLTVAQLRTLTNRMHQSESPGDDRMLSLADLTELGYGREFAENILFLLSREEQLDYYVNRAKRSGCFPVTRISEHYPVALRHRLGADAPGSLWAKGDRTLLNLPCIALVGSRELHPDNCRFAEETGRQAALQGYVLVSGNARGADRTAQKSCLEHGGRVISIVADSLEKCKEEPNMLYISEDGYDCAFSAVRALSRNRLIHAMGALTLVAQCRAEKGGTWDGTVKNLRHHYSPVFCYQDGSEAVKALTGLGAVPVDAFDLADFHTLQNQTITFFE